ncbi:MAG: hypothetical protein QGH62_06635 [Nitrospinaceae bacterium]|nr:hypothetical protein [Nitrospinaceae bacterium]
MIQSTFEEAHSQEWISQNIPNRTHELVILRQVIPWDRIMGGLVLK